MFPTNETSRGQTLLVRFAAHTCALDLAQVVEIMRPLPIERVAGAPDLVRGLAVIRGVPVPVVGLPASLIRVLAVPLVSWWFEPVRDRSPWLWTQ